MVAPIPNTSFSFPNNGLGNVSPSATGVLAVIGATSAGTANTPTSIAGSPNNVSGQFGYGPASSLAAALVSGGSRVVLIKAVSTPATPGAVTKVGSGATVMTITGTPFDRYNIVVTCVRGGTVDTDATCQVTVSLDGGRTTSRPYNLPLDGDLEAFVATTGLTFSFTAATIVAGDTFSSYVPAPVVAAADVVDAVEALGLSTHSFEDIYVCGAFDADDCSTITTEVAALIPRKRFTRVLFESVDDEAEDGEAQWAADLIEDFVDFASDLAVVSAGYIGVADVFTKAFLWRSIGWLAAVRLSQVAVHRDLAAVEDGGLTAVAGGVTMGGTPAPDRFVHDEDLNPLLNDFRFQTIRSFPGVEFPGYYITNPNVMSAPTSDYDLLQYGRTADRAATLTNTFFTRNLSRDLFLDPTTGRLLESEAKSLEQGNDNALAELIANKSVSGLRTVVDRTPTGRTISVTVYFVPKFYAKEFAVTIAFVNVLPAAAA